MIELIIYLGITMIFFVLLMYLSGIKEGTILSLMAVIIGLSWLAIERIIENKDFDVITVVLGVIVACLIIIVSWLRKKFMQENPGSRKKKKKKK